MNGANILDGYSSDRGVSMAQLYCLIVMLILEVSALSPLLYGFATTAPRVRFTGVLVPPGEQNRKGALESLEILIGKEKRIFLLDKMEIIGSTGVNRAVLQRLFPPVVRFFGADDLLLPLKSPKITGKLLTIDGHLYPDSRMLFVTGVDDGEVAGTN
jgi:hypothetical protein